MSHDLESAQAQVEERLREFCEDHKDFDPRWVRDVLHSLAEILPYLFAHHAVEEGIELFYKATGIKLPPDFNSLSADEDLPLSCLEALPLFRNYRALRAFAFYGLKIDSTQDDGMSELLEFIDIGGFPPQWWQRDEEAARTIWAAFARRKLDAPEWGIGILPEELAALAGVSRKSIMNLLAPKGGNVFEIKADGTIKVDSARRWLEARSDFRASIWHLQEAVHPDPQPLIEGDPIWVPVTDDETWFSPEHERDGLFHVASREQEEVYEDYWEALGFLSRATSPRWRYPDKRGRWYMRPATGWERKTRQEIERLLEQTRNQPKPKKGRR